MRLLFPLLLGLLLAAGPVRAQPAGPEGVWLIAQESFDDLVEAGVVITHYPVLAIDPGGSFRLQFMTMGCHPLDAAGRLLDAGENAACERAADALRPVLGGALGYSTLAGSWVIEGRDLRLTGAPAGPIPREEAERLRQTPLSDVPAARRATLRQMAGSFHTGWFIGNGAPVMWQRVPNRLTLIGRRGGPTLVHWDLISPAELGATGAVIAALQASGASYFRCVLAAVRRAGQGRDPHGLLGLAGLGKRFRAVFAALETPPTDGAALAALAAEREQIDAELAAHSLVQAVAARPLGALLGCPERDALAR